MKNNESLTRNNLDRMMDKIKRRQTAKLLEFLRKKYDVPAEMENDISRSYHFAFQDTKGAVNTYLDMINDDIIDE